MVSAEIYMSVTYSSKEFIYYNSIVFIKDFLLKFFLNSLFHTYDIDLGLFLQNFKYMYLIINLSYRHKEITFKQYLFTSVYLIYNLKI